MERKDKNGISIFLLAVGVSFILIAGSIFVSSAWHYMTESMKKFLLFGVVVILFVGSEKLSASEKLEKAGTALYYLGVGFSGFFMISLLRDIQGGNEVKNLCISHLAMLVLAGIRFVRKRNGFSFGVLWILLDGCLVWGSIGWEIRFGQFLLLLAVLILLFSVADCQRERWMAAQTGGSISRGLNGVFVAGWVFHVLLLIWLLFFEMIFLDDFYVGEGFLFLLLLLTASAIVCRERETTILYVVNSMLLFGTIFAGVHDLCSAEMINDLIAACLHRSPFGDSGELAVSYWEMAFVTFLIYMGFLCRMKRRDMLSIQVLTGVMLVITQPYFEISEQFIMEWRCGLLAIGVVLLGHIWYDEWEESKKVQFALICILLAVLLCHDIQYGCVWNAVILGVVGVFLLLVAKIRNQKEYMVAASVLLLLTGLYLTRDFWLSIAWWVYLLIAGIVLILVAAKIMTEER